MGSRTIYEWAHAPSANYACTQLHNLRMASDHVWAMHEPFMHGLMNGSQMDHTWCMHGSWAVHTWRLAMPTLFIHGTQKALVSFIKSASMAHDMFAHDSYIAQ